MDKRKRPADHMRKQAKKRTKAKKQVKKQQNQQPSASFLHALQAQRENQNQNRPTEDERQTKQTTAKEIPGFYYDEKLQKYFRVKDRKQPKTTSSGQDVRTLTRPAAICPLAFLRSRERGSFISQRQTYDRHSQSLVLRQLQPVLNDAAIDDVIGTPSTLLDIHPTQKLIARDVNGSNLSIGEIVGTASWHIRNFLYQPCLSKITDLRWKPSDADGVVACLTLANAQNPSLLEIHKRSLPKDTISIRGSAWRVEWNPFPLRESVLGIGTSSGVLLVDIEGDKKFFRPRQREKVDTFCLSFMDKGISVLQGARNGIVSKWDTRTRNAHLIDTHCGASITNLHVLQDDRRIIISDTNGKVHLHDLRMQQKIVEYIGHPKTHHRNRFCVAETESVITAAGVDGYVRTWDLRTGHLSHLQKFDYTGPCSISCIYSFESFPSVDMWLATRKGLKRGFFSC